jgi:PEP-CTERM motif-containing protein
MFSTEQNSLGIYPGNQYAALGILFRTGSVTGNVAVGNTVTLDNSVDGFEVLGGPGQPAISPPNFAIPLGAGLNDLLMTFTTPVTSVQLTSDNYPETPDVIRLIALAATPTPNQFTVLAFDQKLDDAVAPPDNLLSVNLGGAPFSYAAFEITTEQEEFDDLRFTPTPEPSTLVLAALALLGPFAIGARRRFE